MERSLADCVRVISLDRTPARFVRFLELNPGLPVERFSAVDGRSLDRRRLADDGLITAENPYSDGALGLLASHVSLWRRCATGQTPLHIAEDDAVFRRDFLPSSASALSQLRDWDVVLWGWNFDWPMKLRLAPGLGTAVLHGNETELRAEWHMFVNVSTSPILARLVSAAGTPCYSISPAGAAKLLSMALPVAGRPASYPADPTVQWNNTGVDVDLSRHFEKLSAYVALPPLVATLNDRENSTIRRADLAASLG